jgi:hypothetical protein
MVDEDVFKMNNRIRMLQLEEEKALRKIEETRRKANTILEVRMNKGSRTKRILSPIERAMTPEERPSIFFERKEEHKRALQSRIQSIMERRQ